MHTSFYGLERVFDLEHMSIGTGMFVRVEVELLRLCQLT
jgi:hypothetical protein